MLTIHVWPKWLKEFLLTHPLYKSPHAAQPNESMVAVMTRNGCACGIQCGFPMRQLQNLCDYGRDKPVPPEWDES